MEIEFFIFFRFGFGVDFGGWGGLDLYGSYGMLSEGRISLRGREVVKVMFFLFFWKNEKEKFFNYVDYEKNCDKLINNRLNLNKLGLLGFFNCFGFCIVFYLMF